MFLDNYNLKFKTPDSLSFNNSSNVKNRKDCSHFLFQRRIILVNNVKAADPYLQSFRYLITFLIVNLFCITKVY